MGIMDETSFKAWLDEFEAPLYEQWVKSYVYDTYSNKTTVVVLTLKSGFEIVGTSGCEDPLKFNEQLGHKYALKDALRKLGEFAAFYRAQTNYLGGIKEIRAESKFTDEQLKQIQEVFVGTHRALNSGIIR